MYKRQLKSRSVVIVFLAMALILLNLQTSSISAQNFILGEKIKKAEKNIVWSDNKYDRYYNFGETIAAVIDNKEGKYINLVFIDKTSKKILNTK